MHDLYLQVDSLDAKKPGIVPWAIGLLALGTLVLCTTRDISGIQSDIRASAASMITSTQVTNVSAHIDGRDVTLAGTMSTEIDRDAFVAHIAGINGVRVVRDEMTAFDPREQAKIERLEFRQALDSIDTSTVAFQPNSASLSLSSESALLRVAQLLKSTPDHQIKIAGHTDNTGNSSRNLDLSRSRAQSVANFLLSSGVSNNQLIVQGYGHTRPQYDNSTEVGRSKNRRIEFIFMK